MSSFEKSWPVLREHEGTRFSNHKWDPGGATKFGITLKYARQAVMMPTFMNRGIILDMDDDGDVDEKDIELLDEPTAIEVYREWWDRCRYGDIVVQHVATKVMDMSINMGPVRAHRYTQLAVIQCGYNIRVDGILGSRESFPAINKCEPRELLLELCHTQTEHYRRWCDAEPQREVARAGLHKRGAWPFVPGGYC